MERHESEPAEGPRRWSWRPPPPAARGLLDDFADLLDELTAEERRVLVQRLSDDFYDDPQQRLPNRARVIETIWQLGFSPRRGHHHHGPG